MAACLVGTTVAPYKNRIISDINCVKCRKIVRNGILCDLCDLWNHFKCVNVPEDNLPDENTEWFCPKCVSLHDNMLNFGTGRETRDKEDEKISLLEVISCLQNDQQVLKSENERLKSDQIVNIAQPSGPVPINDVDGRRWESIPLSKSVKPRPMPIMDDVNFPVLSNRYSVLSTVEDDNDCASSTSDRPRPKQVAANTKHSSRPNLEVIRPKSKNRKHTAKIHLYSDSQGRNVSRMFEKRDSDHMISAFVKPSARFKDIVPSESGHFESDDFVVLLGGTNDVACNEASELCKTLRNKLNDLRLNNVIVFSVPYRHDLPDWSCVNEEVRKINCEIQKVCKRFKNCTFVDISGLGKSFHTENGFHLNWRGKQFVSDKIIECVDNYFSVKDKLKSNPIPLSDSPSVLLAP